MMGDWHEEKERLRKLTDEEIEEYAKKNNLDPIILKLVVRTSMVDIANQIIGI